MNRNSQYEDWNENRNRHQQEQYGNWQYSNQQRGESRNREGYMVSPGSNYAAGSFSGAGYGHGLQEDKYRGYYSTGNQERNFGSNYNATYGNDWYRQTNEPRENYGDYRRVNYIPDNDENRSDYNRDYEESRYGTSGHYGPLRGKEKNESVERYRSSSRNRDRRNEESESTSAFGYGGHYGAGGNYGSFGGPASSRLNVPEQRKQERTGAYSSDSGYQKDRVTSGHRGKGPRGYQRSETRILEDINDRLSDDAYLDASGIEVKIENGVAILSGSVESKNAKRRAEDIAESVRGVTEVENRLHVE